MIMMYTEIYIKIYIKGASYCCHMPPPQQIKFTLSFPTGYLFWYSTSFIWSYPRISKLSYLSLNMVNLMIKFQRGFLK